MTASRPNSFFGLDSSPKALTLSLADGLDDAGVVGEVSDDRGAGGKNSVAYPKAHGNEEDDFADDADDEEPTKRPRPSSFFGMEQATGHIPTPSEAGANGRPADGVAGAPAISTAPTAFAGLINRDSAPSPVSIAPSQSASNYGAERSVNSGAATRPASIAPTLNGPLLDHSHLRPGEQAALLSHNKTLELYRMNAKKTNDPDLVYELAVFMIENAKSMGGDDSSGGSGPTGSGSSIGAQGKEETARDDLFKEAVGLLKKIADRGHPDAQYFLADCYANGVGTTEGKQDFNKAYPLFVLAAKHGHPDAAYRAGMCYEKGWGCRRDPSKAVQFYRKAGAQSHPGAMYRLGTAELNGDLNMKKSAREGVKWLKRSADAATPEFPHALHELALLHERGIDNVLFVDPEYSCELLAQAGEMGYAPSAYKLGVNYEYGRMGCPQDAGLSIHMYNIAAQQDHKEACFALTAWYLVGAPGILPQSDTEAYLWAKKAANQGLAKAEYAVGYFTEMGIGCVRDMPEAQRWYRSAAEHGDKRANQRLSSMGIPMASENKILSSLGIRRGSEPASSISGAASRASAQIRADDIVNGTSAAQKALSAREQGLRIASELAARQQQQQLRQQQQHEEEELREQIRQQQQQQQQPSITPLSPPSERGGLSPIQAPTYGNPDPGHPMAGMQTYRPPPPAQSRPLPPPQGQSPIMQQQQRPPPMSPQQQRPPMSPQQYRPTMSPQQQQRSPQQQGSPQQFVRPRPQYGQARPALSPQLTQQFQNMQMRGGPNMPPRPPMQHDYVRNGAPNGGGPPSSVSSHTSAPSSRHSSNHSHGGQGPPPPHAMRRPPHDSAAAYLQQQRPPPLHAQQAPFRPMFRPPQRQNSAPPGKQNGLPDHVGYPTYPNLPNPEHTYRPGIPVTQQPAPSDLAAFTPADADKKKSLWQQLKAI